MKTLRILLFFISTVLISNISVAQTETIEPNDTITQPIKYGLRVGVDISKPIRSLLDKDYSGFEITGDFRFREKFYLAAEIGNEKKDYFEPNLNASTSGSYIKLGVDYNAYNNWLGLNNAIFTGLRYGASSFKQELLAYTIYTTNQTFPTTAIVEPQEFTGLTASWVEFIAGVKTEIYKNLYLSINVQLKRQIGEKTPEGFDNLYIPGFNKTYDFSEFGVGYGYTVSYLVPIFTK
ncbi:hypothetical protein ULMS_20740 [Patiriisocius marinistellae]|uniref:Outer membrane protein beta-barrel domain-containing protein n=1 Tax=Patiriisocius marinistellae TaxID=2494560 RepID=A0A5J4G1U5_9FLAO|nr:DUF6048 family protein [Patiriisocius marinistellae]GEQ86566.1 hypothetical protein ULMS_20740 [Patiriisocius marinistellae]